MPLPAYQCIGAGRVEVLLIPDAGSPKSHSQVVASKELSVNCIESLPFYTLIGNAKKFAVGVGYMAIWLGVLVLTLPLTPKAYSVTS